MSMENHGYLVYGIDLGDGDIPEGVSEAIDEGSSPAAIVGYGMDGTGTIIALESTLQHADIHAAEAVDLNLDDAEVAEFKNWCKEHGLDEAPGWLLAASVG
jgi:hypothetical protein